MNSTNSTSIPSFSFKRAITSSQTSWLPALTPIFTCLFSCLASDEAEFDEFDDCAAPHAANDNAAAAATNNFLKFILFSPFELVCFCFFDAIARILV